MRGCFISIRQRFRPCFSGFFGGKQRGIFDEATEFFFAHVMMRAFACAQVVKGFILHFQALEMNDLHVGIALLPDLSLLQSHDSNLSGARVGDNTRPRDALNA